METLSQCIYAWMRAEDINTSQLAEMLGYKSRTSLVRLLHRESNYHSCFQFCELIAPHLDKGWKDRFRQALLAEKIGIERLALLDALGHCLFEGSKVDHPSSRVVPSVPLTSGTVAILGCPCPVTFSFIDELLASSDQLQVFHYFTRRDIFDIPELLPGLIDHVVSMNYSAVLLDEKALFSASLPWNIALWTDQRQAFLLLLNNEEGFWQELSGGFARVQNIFSTLETLPGTLLYRYEHLQTSKDYIAFTEQNYRMEYNRKALIFKPTPGIQMLPAEIVEQTFIDFLAENLEPVSAARDTLIYIYEKRVKNFYSRLKPTYLMLSFESMLRFARDGVLADHFFACRPFTKAERISIICMLQTFSQRKDVIVSFRKQGSWRVSMEVYDGKGALFYPSSSNYNAAQRKYRELFLPGKEYSNLLFQYASESGFFEQSSSESDDDIYRKLLTAVNGAKQDR